MVCTEGSLGHGYPYYPKLELEGLLFDHVLGILSDSLNSTLDKRYFDDPDFVNSSVCMFESNLKYDLALRKIDIGIGSDGVDYSQFDYSVSIDTGAVCIVVPHSDFMSQGLVIFKSFSLWVWVFVLITSILYILSQLIFQHIQYKVFYRLYSEAEIDLFKSTSSILTVYAYFICGRPPSLLLGHLFTGKVLFFIFSFSALIISTIFLSSMTTLLSERVPGAEIDTLKMLQESEIFIQTDFLFDVANIQSAFDRQNLSEALKAKVVNNLDYYIEMVLAEMLGINRVFLQYMERDINRSMIIRNISDDMMKIVEDNIRAMATMDAFLVHLPTISTPRESVIMQHKLIKEGFKYHLVKECLMTYPIMISFEKNSFLFDKFNQIIARYLEGGLARRFLEHKVPSNIKFDFSHSKTDGGKPPRPYGLNDLQSAFIGLFVGLILSFLTFVGELSINYF
ncbi:unnamed protein product [Bemisia tabaci]|uniref:Ionotropic receptor n=1 Tax=Bemisia tabaci TaxID=7038 RepID=A0A9P0AG07_BEMTA|nr:unnamed protein product [Bemisia tabaci]